MKPKFRSLIAAFAPLQRTSLIVCASFCAATAAHADQTWTGATAALWTTATNWSGSALPDNTENAVFDASSIANLTIDTAADQAVGGILLTSPSGPVTISNNILTLGGGGIDMSAATQNLSINSAVVAGANASQAWSVASGATLTLGGGQSRAVSGIVNVDLSAGGIITDSLGTASSLVGGMTYNGSDIAGLDASNNVVSGISSGAIYVSNPANDIYFNPASITYNPSAPAFDVIDVVQDNTSGQGSAFRLTTNTYVPDRGGLRFGTAHPSGAAWVANFKNPLYQGGLNMQVVVGSAVDTDVILGTNSAGLRSNASGSNLDISNFSTSPLYIRTQVTEGGGRPRRVTKNGSGPVYFSNNATGATNGWSFNEGTVFVGEGGVSGNLTGAINIASGATLALNRSDTGLVLGQVISGDGVINQIGGGVATLSGINTYAGGTNITVGTIAASAVDNFGTGDINIDGGGVQLLADFDLPSANVVIGASGATFDTNGNAVTFSSAFASGSAGSVTKTGAGSLDLAASNDYSGDTAVTAGTLLVSGSGATGSGTVTVDSGATLGGSGSISGDVVVSSGANVAPGASVGNLTVGTLDLNSGSTATFEFNPSPANDSITVSSPGGLTIDGGAITLVEEGSAVAFTTPGTYDLISYSGSIGGAGTSSLTVANPQAGFSYVFANNGSNVTLTIATTGTVGNWNVDGGGSWTTASNWGSDPNIPSAAGDTAIFDFSLTGGPAVVTLDGTQTVGAITFLGLTNGYTIIEGTGGSIIMDNNGSDGAINNNGGIHEISAPITLNSNIGLSSVSAAEVTTLSGVISGVGSITKPGPGSLFLLGANDFTGDLVLTGGSTTFASGGLGDGDLTISNASLTWDAGNTQDISDRTVTFGDDPVTFDTNGNDVTLANDIGDSGNGAFTKAGLGTLILEADTVFYGDVTIADGVLQLGNAGTTGTVLGNILNNGGLVVNHSADLDFTNVISGTGTLDYQGSAVLQLNAPNTFSGDTTIGSAGSIALFDSLALQSSTLQYSTTGGTLSFDLLTAASLGGLNGNRDLPLLNEDTIPAAVALTVGASNSDTTYSGILSGVDSSLTKVGTGKLTLEGINTYTGATLTAAGALEIGYGGEVTTTTANVEPVALLHINGGSLTASALTAFYGQAWNAIDGLTAGITISDGVASFNGGLISGNADGSNIIVNGGILNTTTLELRRTASFGNGADPSGPAADATGLVVNDGQVNISSALTIGTSNSSCSVLVNGGILNTANSSVIVGNNSATERWNILEVRSGTFNSTEAVDGVLISPRDSSANKGQFLVSGGDAFVEKISFGTATSAVGAIGRVSVSSGALYIGSGGVVLNAAPADYTAQFDLTGGTLAAQADWSSSVPVNLGAAVNSTIRTADFFGNPYNITLSGAVTGTGSLSVGVIGGDGGTLTITGPHSYPGNTYVDSGVLSVSQNGFDDAFEILVDTGAVLDLNFGGGDLVAGFSYEGSPMADGIYGALDNTTPGIIQTAAITGTGLLYVNTALPASGYSTWADANAGSQPADGDFDLDGMSNGVEYFLNAPAGFTANPGLIGGTVSWTNGGNIDSSAYGSEFVVQTSTNLATWSDVLVTDPNLSNTAGSVSYTPTAPAPLFTRLKVTPN